MFFSWHKSVVLISLLVLVLGSQQLKAQIKNPPSTMVKITVRVLEKFPSSKLPLNSRTIWRGGDQYLRVNDSENKTISIQTPLGSWYIDAARNVGKHINSHQSPHLAIFGNAIRDLEFGNEYQFFLNHDAHKQQIHNLDSFETTVNGAQLILTTAPGKTSPLTISIVSPDKSARMKLGYDSYQQLKFEPAVFEPTPGLKKQPYQVSADKAEKLIQNIRAIKLGMAYSEVVKILGQPDEITNMLEGSFFRRAPEEDNFIMGRHQTLKQRATWFISVHTIGANLGDKWLSIYTGTDDRVVHLLPYNITK
jgi:hypothetical protein